MKVIQKDNLNRDYQPERLITVSIDADTAKLIADNLNNSPQDCYFYQVVGDDYVLNLDSMYDVVGEPRPESFVERQYGLRAFTRNPNVSCKVHQ